MFPSRVGVVTFKEGLHFFFYPRRGPFYKVKVCSHSATGEAAVPSHAGTEPQTRELRNAPDPGDTKSSLKLPNAVDAERKKAVILDFWLNVCLVINHLSFFKLSCKLDDEGFFP